MGSSEPGFSTLLHPVVNGIEPHQSDNNEIDRDDKVQKSRHDQNEDAGDKGDKRRDMGGGDDSGFASGLECNLGRRRVRGRGRIDIRHHFIRTDEIGDWRDVLQELGKTPPTITGDLEGHRW
jgi:hypothetical protein